MSIEMCEICDSKKVFPNKWFAFRISENFRDESVYVCNLRFFASLYVKFDRAGAFATKISKSYFNDKTGNKPLPKLSEIVEVEVI